MIRLGMRMKSGSFDGYVWRRRGDFVISLTDKPLGFPCDYRVHNVRDISVKNGVARASPASELYNRKAQIAKSWERADT